MDRDQWTQVGTASSQVEAEMLRDLLVSEGIGSMVQTSDAAAYLGVISPCRILVRHHDVERASAFLDAWESAEVHIEDGFDVEHDGADEQ
jgi:hypothetical protein